MSKHIIGSIYVLENKINGRRYIGQSINVKRRMIEHKHEKNDFPITRAIKKYGFENFKQYIFNGIPIDMLDYCEKQLIIALSSFKPNGYNLHIGGNSNRELSEETKKKISIGNIGKVHGNKGIPLSSETKYKISMALRGDKHYNYGKHRSEETKLKIRLARIGKPNPSKGKKRTEEQRKRMSDSRKGMTAWNKGKKLSFEHRKHLSDSHKGIPNNQLGRKHSDTAKLKMSLARKGKLFPYMIHCKPVICIETGQIYASIKEAEEKTKLHNISTCCRKNNKIKGYHWEYYKETA
jgi:group I intron endonuclease